MCKCHDVTSQGQLESRGIANGGQQGDHDFAGDDDNDVEDAKVDGEKDAEKPGSDHDNVMTIMMKRRTKRTLLRMMRINDE